MKKEIIIAIAAVPLLGGLGQNLAASQDIDVFDLQAIMVPKKIVLIKHDTSQIPPVILAARDGKEEDCHWIGTCKDNG